MRLLFVGCMLFSIVGCHHDKGSEKRSPSNAEVEVSKVVLDRKEIVKNIASECVREHIGVELDFKASGTGSGITEQYSHVETLQREELEILTVNNSSTKAIIVYQKVDDKPIILAINGSVGGRSFSMAGPSYVVTENGCVEYIAE